MATAEQNQTPTNPADTLLGVMGAIEQLPKEVVHALYVAAAKHPALQPEPPPASPPDSAQSEAPNA